MNKKKKIPVILQIVMGLILFLFITSLSVVGTLNFRPLYYADIDHLKISEYSGYTKEEIRLNYDALIDYNSLFNKEPLQFPTMAMSESGRIHFEEVKVIFNLFGYMAIITAIPALLILITAFAGRHRDILRSAGLIGILTPALLGGLIAMNWDWFFVTFHELVFNNDYWIFNYETDPVILILPDTFFMHCAIMIIALILILSAICLICSRNSRPASARK